MFQVEWIQSALDELARLWTQADSSSRQALTGPVARLISDSNRIRSTKANLD